MRVDSQEGFREFSSTVTDEGTKRVRVIKRSLSSYRLPGQTIRHVLILKSMKRLISPWESLTVYERFGQDAHPRLVAKKENMEKLDCKIKKPNTSCKDYLHEVILCNIHKFE